MMFMDTGNKHVDIELLPFQVLSYTDFSNYFEYTEKLERRLIVFIKKHLENAFDVFYALRDIESPIKYAETKEGSWVV